MEQHIRFMDKLIWIQKSALIAVYKIWMNSLGIYDDFTNI